MAQNTTPASFDVPTDDFPLTIAAANPRKLLPFHPAPPHLVLYPPPLPLSSTHQPRQPRLPALASKYTLTTHVIPGAYPRVAGFRPILYEVNTADTKEERKHRVRVATEKLSALKSRDKEGKPCYHADACRDDGRVLWNTVARYVKKDLAPSESVASGTLKRPITLILTHANGFPKEIFEPFLAHLTSFSESSASTFTIEEVWSFEAVQHGDAGLINASKLGSFYDWSDNTRDILNFLLHYLPENSSQPQPQPTHLPLLPQHISDARRQSGFADRELVAIGHSFGGCTVAQAALAVPILFSTMLLVDPVITTEYFKGLNTNTIASALGRRIEWPSREEALRQVKTSPFFSSWDLDALDVYLECGFTELPNGHIIMKTTGFQEGVVFNDANVPFEVYGQLHLLDPRIALHFFFPDMAHNSAGGARNAPHLAWRRPVNASNELVPGCGHLIVQEGPKYLGERVYKYLQGKYAGSTTGNLKARL